MVILDTDHISFLERKDSPVQQRLADRLDATGDPRPIVTIISYEEQVRGWLKAVSVSRSVHDQVRAYDRLLEQLRNYCAWIVLPFDELAAAKFQGLRKQKLRIGTMDLKIAAIALTQGAKLLSRNLSDFGLVPGLQVEDWTK